MPSLLTLLHSAPPGFIQGCKSFSSALESDAGVADEVMSGVLLSKQADEAVSNTHTSWLEETKAVSYIMYCCQNASPSPAATEIASCLDVNTFLTRTAIAAIVSGVERIVNELKSGDNEGTASVQTTNFGRLSNLKWHLGVTMSSSECQNMSSPYVSMSFDIVDNNGNKQAHTTEMSYSEFVAFTEEFVEVNKRMKAM